MSPLPPPPFSTAADFQAPPSAFLAGPASFFFRPSRPGVVISNLGVSPSRFRLNFLLFLILPPTPLFLFPARTWCAHCQAAAPAVNFPFFPFYSLFCPFPFSNPGGRCMVTLRVFPPSFFCRPLKPAFFFLLSPPVGCGTGTPLGFLSHKT